MSISLTFKDFEELIGRAYQLDAAIDKLELEQLKPMKQELSRLEGMILDGLVTLDKSSYRSAFGTVVKQNRFSVTTPKTIDDKKAFFGWLGTKGDEVLWQFTTVNSQSLNALYKAELEIAKESGNVDFALPGIGPATVIPTLARRKT